MMKDSGDAVSVCRGGCPMKAYVSWTRASEALAVVDTESCVVYLVLQHKKRCEWRPLRYRRRLRRSSGGTLDCPKSKQ